MKPLQPKLKVNSKQLISPQQLANIPILKRTAYPGIRPSKAAVAQLVERTHGKDTDVGTMQGFDFKLKHNLQSQHGQ